MRRLTLRPRRAALPLLALLALACHDAVAPGAPIEMGADGATVGTLVLRTSAVVVGAPVPGGPAMLQATVTLTNRGAWPLELRPLPCPLQVTAHRTAARDDAPAFVLPSVRAPYTESAPCAEPPRAITLAPGESQDLAVAADAGALRAAGASGRYYLLADLRLEGTGPLRLAAGDVTL